MGRGRCRRSRRRPLIGGLLVDLAGWQGLFWIDAAVAGVCMIIAAGAVGGSRDPDRPRTIDYAGGVLVALTLTPLVLAVSKGSDWGWTSPATLGSLAVSVVSGFAFVAVERRVQIPMLDLGLLRNRVLVGSTVAILIGAGTINALMYVLSLYLQDPSTLDLSPLEAGMATLPATVGLVVVAPLVPKMATKLGGPQVGGLGFAVTAAGFGWVGHAGSDWRYAAFVVPLVLIAVGMGMSNVPASAVSTACVPANQVGEASGVSNMARYVGAAVATALAATVYSTVTANQADSGHAAAEALTSGLQATAWVMAGICLAGVVMAVVMGRHAGPSGTLEDSAAAAAAHTHTLPTSATPTAAAGAGPVIGSG